MTVRVLDVQASVLIGQGDPYRDVTWAGVLRSLAAHQMYHRTLGGGVSGPGALRFLLLDERFPRAVRHCITAAGRHIATLPNPAPVHACCSAAQKRLADLEITARVTPSELHELVDLIELDINKIHRSLAATYFGPTDTQVQPQTQRPA
jgi:uncharacterized alpha-E superfamily protein